MKLADAQSDSARQRLRQSNLDDLENAFKEESPLTDSNASSVVNVRAQDLRKDDASDDILIAPFKRKEKNSLLVLDDRGSVGTTGGPGALSLSEEAGRVEDPAQMKTGLLEVASFSDNPMSNERHNTTGPTHSANVSTGHSSNIVQHSTYNSARYGPVNPPQFDRNQNRRTIIGAVLILLALCGLAIGLFLPGRGSRSSTNPVNGTYSLAPTFSPTTNRLDTDFDIIYTNAADILNDAMVSYPAILSKDCYHIQCNGSGNIGDLDIRAQVIHYLVFEDPIFRTWVSRNDFDNVERVVQRYIITLFAFETGLVKNVGDEKNTRGEWKVKTWERNDNWLGDEDECDWFGIVCQIRSAYEDSKDFKDHTFFTSTALKRDLPDRPTDKIPMITEISLNENNLDGNLIPELFRLRHLEKVELWKSELRGSLDSSIKLLASLKTFWVHETKFITGTIPSEIGELSDLESIFIGGNKLTGGIPSQLGNLKNLKTLALHENSLKGSIPNEISACTKLERLFMDNNELSGTIPISLGALTSLNDFRIDNNQLTGPMPVQFGEMKELKVFYISKNKLSGNIADVAVVGWQKMEHFEASDNQFTGTIPMRFGTLPSLVTLDLHSNKLNSQIPTNICNGANKALRKLDLSSNLYVLGKIPAEVSRCTNMETLTLSNNQMTGTIPAFLFEFQMLKNLNLDRNLFSGEINSGLGGRNITSFRVVQNNVQGVINKGLCNRVGFISADCGSDGSLRCENNCCGCCDLSCN